MVKYMICVWAVDVYASWTANDVAVETYCIQIGHITGVYVHVESVAMLIQLS